MSRPREWRQASRAKAEVVVSERYIGAACSNPAFCRAHYQICSGACEKYDIEQKQETTDAISGNRLCPLTGQSCFRSLCYNADRCEEETTDASE